MFYGSFGNLFLLDLKTKNANIAAGFIIVSSFLFFMGVIFGYYVIAPLSVHFMLTYELSEFVETQPSIQSYVAYIRASSLASGILFELPYYHSIS